MDVPAQLPAGTQLDGTYTIQTLLGMGGIGVTYLALDSRTGAKVAIKEFSPQSLAVREAGDVIPKDTSLRDAFEAARLAFLRRARAMSVLQHPSIVRITRIFAANGTAYAVYDYVNGIELGAWLHSLGRQPSQAELDQLLKPVLDALEMCHNAGIVHGGIDPTSIRIRPDGHPVLVGFHVQDAPHIIRQRDYVVGQDPFQPIELVAGASRPVGPWTDIYELAAVIYQGVTGNPPPTAINRLSHDTMVPAQEATTVRQGYRSAFLEAIDAGLRLSPQKRPQSIMEWRPMVLGDQAGYRSPQAPQASARTAVPAPFSSAAFITAVALSILIIGLWAAIPTLRLPQSAPREMTEPERRARIEREIQAQKAEQARAVALLAACIDQSMCTPVPIYFGTDRKRADQAARIDFGSDRGGSLQLGRAIVSVPKAVPRRLGEIPRPSWFERTFLGVPSEGDPAKHFTILQNGIAIYDNADAFVAAVHKTMADAHDYKDHAFVFVHGYRTSFDGALYRSAQIAYDLGSDGETFGTAFLYSWPSGGELKDYQYDFDSARFTVDHLKTFLNLVITRSGATQIHLIAHSMGNWPLLTALSQMAVPPDSKARINQIVLAAPDVDAKEFQKLADTIKTLSEGVTLYASSNDLAMRASREIHKGTLRAGDVGAGTPVVMAGVDTIDVSSVSTEVFALGHSQYADRRELLNDIALLLRKGERPPHIRTPILARMRVNGMTYWKYPE